MKRIEDLISKCVRGKTSRDIIREIEDELPDLDYIVSELQSDLRRLTNFNPDKLRIEDSKVIVETNEPSIKVVLDTYSRVYPEIEFLLSGGCNHHEISEISRRGKPKYLGFGKPRVSIIHLDWVREPYTNIGQSAFQFFAKSRKHEWLVLPDLLRSGGKPKNWTVLIDGEPEWFHRKFATKQRAIDAVENQVTFNESKDD